MEKTELAKAYVQIIPSAKGIGGMLQNEVGGETDAAGKSLGGRIGGAIKVAVIAAGIGKAISASISEGAELEQSIGGIETLFKDSAEKVKQNAANAYKTAGMSANEYMQLTTSFSASLLQSLGNDTAKAADVADMAMTDMSDNMNKMGSNMEDIKNAYQGFAKQNYTMLDNLKLGYGGTKTEMERLLADAEKITGVKYDINNLSDVYSAIHVIQGELGITGTTAKEAATTLSGSLASMKAAFKNLLGNIAIGEDVTDELKQVGETVVTFLTGNLIPMIGNVLASIPDLLGKDFAAAGLNMIAENSDQILESGVSFVTSLVTGIITALPYLAEAALNLVASFANAILTMDWLLVAQNLITGLKTGLETAAVETLGTDTNIVDTIMTGISEKLPEFLNKGVEMVTKIANGILESLPQLITMAGEAIVSFVSGMQSMLPTIMQKGAELILNLVNGIITNLPQIASAAGSAIIQYVAAIGRNLPSVLQSGIEIIGKLAAGLIQAIPKLIAQIPTIITNIKNEFLSVDWGKIGLNIIKGIANGLANAAGALWDAVKSALGDFKDNILGFFGIHSPSRWGEYVGNMIDQGIANGISGDAKLVTDSANLVKKAAYDPLTTDLSYTTNIGKIGNENGRRGIEERLDALEEVLITIAGKELCWKYKGKAKMIRYINSEGKEYKFYDARVRATSGNFHKHAWTPETSKRKIGEIVQGFEKDAAEYEITFTVRGALEDRKQKRRI